MTGTGEIIIDADGKIAQIDDRDGAQMMGMMEVDGRPATDDDVMGWLERAAGALVLRYQGRVVNVQPVARDDVPAVFGFIRLPQPVQGEAAVAAR